ncbi:MAG TPA: NUDIX hydrolase, partial [Myxococcota bacterium]|nr:NUDIX hydrolase [Myxococcota bacterium]
MTRDEEAPPTRRVQRGARFELVTESVELPNGRRVELDLLPHPGAAAVLPFLDARTVLLIRQYRFATGGYLLEVPAGKLDPDEAPEACAARELEEETGYRAGRIERLSSIWTSPGFTDEVIHLFVGRDLERTTQQLDPDEIIELVPLPLADALDRVHRGELTDAKSVAALLLAAARPEI